MTHIISVINHKGGVGKTTSTANIAAGLQILGKSALMIDLDPQANLTRHFGLPKTSERSIYDALTGVREMPTVELKNGAHIAPSHQDMIGWEKIAADEPGRELFLKNAINTLSYKYDYILIDCPPSLNLLPINALTASNGIIITVEPSLFSIEGMNNIFSAVEKVRSRINKNLIEYKILITRFFSSKILHKNAEEIIRRNYNEKVFKTVIRTSVALEEAVMNSVDVFAYDSKSNGAKDYMKVCQEIVNSNQ